MRNVADTFDDTPLNRPRTAIVLAFCSSQTSWIGICWQGRALDLYLPGAEPSRLNEDILHHDALLWWRDGRLHDCDEETDDHHECTELSRERRS